ncbi:SDR family oxidoreductase [Tahibacter amnicola]|uniref:SDR family oxidoreductase n=1 Tax=Tahibacter amnicola TaxID=2976241 RepID=A0ABY6BEE0_9GAMM|nr:SDR family oxidoreductase [Tahibacter amnicola]UXI66986.1 SDR family oxidoreductase [Tahibacter amnicola]
MNLDLTGKHALVCGGSQGIGRAAATELAQLGANVTLLARSADTLQALVGQLPRTHAAQSHAYIAVDMADLAALRAKVEATATAAPIQILVNNTGGPPGGLAHGADAAAFLDAFHQHLLANQTLVQAVLPGMRAAAYGRIINVISTSVKEPIKNLGVSNTIRGAVASWSKTLASELGPHGITVNNVLPGYTRTQRLEQIIGERVKVSGKSATEIEQAMLASVPAGRFAQPEEVAAAIAFLASPAAGYINGINVPVDGGRTLSL